MKVYDVKERRFTPNVPGMKVYCVKEGLFTPNEPGSEEIVTTNYGRTMVKVKCASCGITKTRFFQG